MPKPFKHPQIKALAIGESCTIFTDKPSALERSVRDYAARDGKKCFRIERGEVSQVVTRMGDLADPKPVTDTELPGA